MWVWDVLADMRLVWCQFHMHTDTQNGDARQLSVGLRLRLGARVFLGKGICLVLYEKYRECLGR